jgi:hypothetical protein
MTKNDEYHYRPYRRFIFWTVVLVSLALLIIGNFATYVVRSQSIISDIKDELIASASQIAPLVPLQAHESLVQPEQQGSSDYTGIESMFQLIMAGNPAISDIYTLRPTRNPHEMLFIVSGQTTGDTNGDNIIDDNEIKPALGEPYNTEPYPQLEAAIIQPGVDDSINYDKWGAWLSGYAPIKDANGKTLAVLGVDYSADYISGLRVKVWNSIVYIDLILFPLMLFVAWYVSRRLSRPFTILAYGLERLSHGDFEHHLSLSRHKEERVFGELFNRIVSLFAALKHRKPPEE